MAGSYGHITGKGGKFIGTELLDHLGDAYEALEECHWMINFLAGYDRKKIFEAHQAYVAAPTGCNNPEYAAKMTYEEWMANFDQEDEDASIEGEGK